MASIGYVALLRRNHNFRRLWYGQIVSQLGDWLDSIALFTLLLALTGSGQAVGLLLVAEFLPAALVGPFAGVVIDRLPRKLVLVASDLGRALLVLALLFVQDAGDIWIIYTVTVLKVGLAAFFEPARSAIIPSLTRPEELVTANSLSGATWSAVLALGAALGGLVAGTLGTQAAFILDACSFLLSAYLIGTIRSTGEPRTKNREPRTESALPFDKLTNREVEGNREPKTRPAFDLATPFRDLAAGLRYLRQERDVRLYTFIKALWSLGGGVLLLLTLYGQQLFPLGEGGALSIGLLYAARGVGAAIGPLLANRLGGEGVPFLRRAVGPAIILTGIGYIAVSASPVLPLAMLAVLLAHMGGSTQWV
ncbi:MAG: MFS transporter, partial [Chloroflexaceae bacterium]|nr:MFS transporter [Chloroflexaceae bacterium]